jgi:Rhamnan synthesis protein F
VAILIHLLKKLLAKFSFTVFSLKVRLRDYLQIRILGKHKKVKVLKLFESDSSKVAIVAVFPRERILISVCRVIDELKNNGYHVVVVVNEGSPKLKDWIAELEKRDLTILSRPNIGRDFGAYQSGLRYVKTLPTFNLLKKIALLNDSVYYFPDSKDFVKKMLHHDAEWQAMFVNFQYHVHAQSFFQIFNHNIFTHKNFTSFWDKYYPTNLRYRVINRGEVNLTKVLMDAGYLPTAFVTAELLERSGLNHGISAEEKFAIWEGFEFIGADLSPDSVETHDLRLRRTFTSLNPSHHVGVVSTRIVKAPIKLDLLRTGLVSLSGLQEVAAEAGVIDPEIRDFISEMSSKGSNSSIAGFHKLWREFGYE